MSIFSRRARQRMAAYQQELTRTHFAEVEAMYRQMRGWRHDYRNHLQTIKVYANAGDLASIQSYLRQLDGELTALDTPVKTGNLMADAILSGKLSLAKAREIPVRAEAHIPVALSISQLDLCVILGNLFDNAIEASMALPPDRRLIRLYMDMKGSQLYISLTNFTAGKKQRKVAGRFASTKAGDHGFGLERMDAVVKRMGGYLNRNSEDGAFTTEILLPQRGPEGENAG